MLSLPALAAKSYYFVVPLSTGTATFLPFPSLGECQRSFGKDARTVPEMQTNECFLK
jgi:hypothetical protein